MAFLKHNLGFTCPPLDRETYCTIRDISNRYKVNSNVPINYFGEVYRLLQEHPEYLTEEGAQAFSTLCRAFKIRCGVDPTE